ncbi:hypothetical protein ACS0TY_028450 [Phlomoides rotata]
MPEGCPNSAVAVVVRIEIVLREVLQTRMLGTSQQLELFQRIVLTHKVNQDTLDYELQPTKL